MPRTARAKRKPAASRLDDSDGRRQRRIRTEDRMIAAVGTLLRKGGVAALGVNAIAETAGVEKVLVYRYFGGIDALMKAYAARSDFWPTLDELIGADGAVLRDADKARAAARVLGNYARALRRRPVTLDLLAYETSHRNELTVALERVREDRSNALFEELRKAEIPLARGAAGIGALVAAAINYLAIRGRDLEVFAGLAVKTDADWDHIEALMYTMFAALGRTQA